ncbi:MAG: hypothetical protein EHM58_06885 [Ignavibacteriae bacterium]|nr:MAG: hypothetical protein EHM58_06885 [Ignavibacteriota bacterium]
MKTFISKFLITFAVVFIVTAGITYLYNLIFHNANNIELETAFQLAIIFAVVLPVLNKIENKKKEIAK